ARDLDVRRNGTRDGGPRATTRTHSARSRLAVGEGGPDGVLDAAEAAAGGVDEGHVGLVAGALDGVADVVAGEHPAEHDERVAVGADALGDGVDGVALGAEALAELDAGAGQLGERLLEVVAAEPAGDE